jgi:hypothetical protein
MVCDFSCGYHVSRLCRNEHHGLVVFSVEEAPDEVVKEGPPVTWPVVGFPPLLVLAVLYDTGGGGVRPVQGALVMPSTIPTGGLDMLVAQGAGVPGPECSGPGATVVVPAFNVGRAFTGWFISLGFLSGWVMVFDCGSGSTAFGSFSHLKSEPKGKC